MAFELIIIMVGLTMMVMAWTGGLVLRRYVELRTEQNKLSSERIDTIYKDLLTKSDKLDKASADLEAYWAGVNDRLVAYEHSLSLVREDLNAVTRFN